MRALVVLVALASIARADSEADALTAQGEQLARDTFQLARVEVDVPASPQQMALANIGGVSLVDIDPTGLSPSTRTSTRPMGHSR